MKTSFISPARWLVRLFAVCGSLLVLSVCLVNFVIDPYGEFRLINAPFNALKLTTRNTSAARLMDKLDEGKHALVFGSSRTYLLSSELLGEPTLNFSSSVYRYPKDIWTFFSMLSEKERNNISRVYILADDRFLNNDQRYFDFGSRLELQASRFANIDFGKVQDACSTVGYNLSVLANPAAFTADITETGAFRQNDVPPAQNLSAILDSPSSEQAFYLDKVMNFLQSRNIDFILFNAPWRLKSISMEPISSASHILQTETLLHHTPKFYDFLRVFNTDDSDALYRDANHLNNLGMKKFAELLMNRREEFAVTSDNFRAFYATDLSDSTVVSKLERMKHIADSSAATTPLQEETLNTALEMDIALTIHAIMENRVARIDTPLDTAINIGYREEKFIRPLFLYGIENGQDVLSPKLLKNAFKNNKKLFKETLTYFHNTGQLQAISEALKLETLEGMCEIGNLDSDLLVQYGFTPGSTSAGGHSVQSNALGMDIPSFINDALRESSDLCSQLHNSPAR